MYDGLVFLNQIEILQYLANRILYWGGKKWLFHLLFVSKSQQQALGINMHSGFSNTQQKTSIASAHTPSPYPTFILWIALASWMVRFCTFLYLNSALWTNSSKVRKLLQNTCILASASLKKPGPLDQIAEAATVHARPSLFLTCWRNMTIPGWSQKAKI